MNSENPNFDQLRKLLALKRYELPPPRYFNDFSSSIIARLSQPQREELSWWQRLGFDFDLRPALMCGVGIVVCGMLSFGLIGAMQAVDSEGGQSAQMATSPMGNPQFDMINASTDVNGGSLIAKQTSSPFSQFAGATPVGFQNAGPFGN
jgi:hypothetical protein